MAIAMPGWDRLPDGPRRGFLAALHVLYQLAGKPPAQSITQRTYDLPSVEPVARGTVSATLRGDSVPSWAKVESIVVALIDLSGGTATRDVIVQFSELWAATRTSDMVVEVTPPAVRANALPEILGGLTAPALACHAALPAVIDSGFLHLLRINFFADPPHTLPYESEAELLLSPLFTELAGDLYEMRPNVRGELLQELVARYDDDRLHKIAALLDRYTAGNEKWRANPELAYAQHMTALAVRDPALAWQRLDEAEQATRRTGDLQREWYVAMRHHLGEQLSVSAPEPPPGDLALSSPDSQTVLIGAASQVTEGDLYALYRLLTDEDYGGLGRESCSIHPPAALRDGRADKRIRRAAETLLVYLSDAAADPDWLPRHLPELVETLETARARRVVLVIENRKVRTLNVPTLRRRGWLALALPPGGQGFSLTNMLIDLLIRGADGVDSPTVGWLYRELSDRMSALGLPSPLLRAAPPAMRDHVEDVVLVEGHGRAAAGPEEQRWLQALIDYEQSGDLENAARCHLRLGDLAGERGDYEAAGADYDRALRAFQSIDDEAGVAEAGVAIAVNLLDPRRTSRVGVVHRLMTAAEAMNRVIADRTSIDEPLAGRLRGLAAALANLDWLRSVTDNLRDRAIFALVPAFAVADDPANAAHAAESIHDRGLRDMAHRMLGMASSTVPPTELTASATLSERRSVLGDDHPETLAAANDLALDLHRLGDYQQARSLDEDTLDRRRRVLGDDHVDTLRTADQLAADLRALGDWQHASQLDEDTLVRRRRVLGDDHLETLRSLDNLANTLSVTGDLDRARELHEDALVRRREVLGHDHPDTLASAHGLATALRLLGDPDRARMLDEDTWVRRLEVLGADDRETMESQHSLAADLSILGELEGALTMAEDVYTRRRRTLGPDDPDTLDSAELLAGEYRRRDDFGRARELAEDTLDRRRRVLGDSHLHTRLSAGNLAGDLRALGEVERARALEEQFPPPGVSGTPVIEA
jgi:tetratricopeptide (TPR) repeat protein